ncbi:MULTISPECIES: DUF6225 family protein [Streptomyces griseus group]|uniref:DUF6225 family protein n=1 Tax=Streptomyces griseus group TaxID=629295 RepID=UPI0037B42BEB|nr:DUF6225 family protein [Streptomyces anulatus]
MNRRISPDGYHNIADAWSVGRLREALANLPEDTVISCSIPLSLAPRGAGDEGDDDDWVLTDLEHPGAGPVVMTFDRPTGRYIYIHREEEEN